MITEREALDIATQTVALYAARHPRPTHVTISQAAKMLGIGCGTAARLLGPQRNACGMVPIEAVDEARACIGAPRLEPINRVLLARGPRPRRPTRATSEAMRKLRPPNPDIVPMLRVADIARRLALSEHHVRERIVTRTDFPAPAFQIGWTRRWEAADVEQWISARQRQRRR